MEKLNGTDVFTISNEYRRPNNAVLVVAGDAEPETMKALAAKTYGKVARGPDLPPRNRPSSPTSRTPRRLVANSDILPPTGYRGLLAVWPRPYKEPLGPEYTPHLLYTPAALRRKSDIAPVPADDPSPEIP
ncbi:insulinase family protein [Mesorhizobium sp. M0029]|uniref:insulinase family protein n=1 Tax=Mesorhizobium sp. M0029 TaxID=2956850 RepID=UPI003338C1F4